MKRFAGILLTAGCLFGASHVLAQGHPAVPAHEFTQSPPPEFPAGSAAALPGVPATELPAEFAARAHAAASALRMLPPEEFGLQWLQEEVNPYQRARRKLLRIMQKRAEQQESVIRKSQKYPHDLNRRTGLWGVGNTGVANWSPFQDRMLDARRLTFPMPRGAKADKRTDQMKALDRMRQQRR